VTIVSVHVYNTQSEAEI